MAFPFMKKSKDDSPQDDSPQFHRLFEEFAKAGLAYSTLTNTMTETARRLNPVHGPESTDFGWWLAECNKAAADLMGKLVEIRGMYEKTEQADAGQP